MKVVRQEITLFENGGVRGQYLLMVSDILIENNSIDQR